MVGPGRNLTNSKSFKHFRPSNPALPVDWVARHVLNRFAEAIQVSQVDVVPKILIAGQAGTDGGSPMTGNVMEALLTLMMSERLGGDAGAISTRRNASADAIRKRIEDDMKR